MIEQTVVDRLCPTCGGAGQIKERPTVRYVDLPVYGQPMRLAWRKHRVICRRAGCAGASWTSADHRIAAKNCLLTTRCAKWATMQVGTGRAVSDVAQELSCDWHTVNDAVMTYGQALLAADRRRLNATTAIGLDETSFVKLSSRRARSYATTVADVANHQIIEILPSRNYVDVAGWIDQQPLAWKHRIRFGALDMSATYAAVYTVMLPALSRSSTRSTACNWPTGPSTTFDDVCSANKKATAAGATTLSTGSAACCLPVRNASTPRPPNA
ncbi:hypothetical protein MCNS_17860 [Mycobacterium conspicuum]|uniref:Transposase IS204/IS1001/IS1096/IS1165 DDE domain-containing protein n=1 Tax=Mycobacterium conspicuum TaxID=44010 RepID=A0A7I7YCK7_9MYCO|nr:hypothetical protein MCNS_17860 [Mycobacterium conspicuum]